MVAMRMHAHRRALQRVGVSRVRAVAGLQFHFVGVAVAVGVEFAGRFQPLAERPFLSAQTDQLKTKEIVGLFGLHVFRYELLDTLGKHFLFCSIFRLL